MGDKDKAKKNVKKFKDNYEQCLMKKQNSDAIINALDIGDYDAVRAVLTDTCKVPADEVDAYMQLAYECYELRYHQW